MQITHLLFTRFNVQYEADDTIGIQPQWLDERLWLFEHYCLPSVIDQTCQNFVWILLGDTRTPEAYKTRIENYTQQVPQIRTYWTGYQNDAYHALYKHIGQTFAKDNDLLISTRLDNDDAIHKDYIARVQKLAQNGIEGIVSFPIGQQIFIKDHKSYTYRYSQNHYTSRIERTGFETIMVLDHTQVAIDALHLVETEEPMWKEIVHGGNLLNDYVPKYHYYITKPSDVWDLSLRWIRFQRKRLVRILKRLVVPANKR